MIDAFVQNLLNNSLFTQEKITATGTWTVPAGIYEVTAILVGGGGAGVSNGSQAEGGGGGEVFIAHNYPVIPADVLTVTIGAGGSSADGTYTAFDLLNACGGAYLSTGNGGKGPGRSAGGGGLLSSTLANGGITSAGGRFVSIGGGGGGESAGSAERSDTPFAYGGIYAGTIGMSTWKGGGGASWGVGGDGSAGTGSDGVEGGGGGGGLTGGDGANGLLILCYRKPKRH